MLRTLVGVVLALLLVVGGLVAAEVKGKVKSYEAGKLTVTADGKDSTYTVNAATKVLTTKGKEVKNREKTLKQLKKDVEVILEVDKDVVKELKIVPKKKKAK